MNKSAAAGLVDRELLDHTGLQPNGVHSPRNKRKRNARQGGWMTDELFPFMRLENAHTDPHVDRVSLWLKCVRDNKPGEKERERRKEGVRMSGWFRPCSSATLCFWPSHFQMKWPTYSALHFFHPARIRHCRCCFNKVHCGLYASDFEFSAFSFFLSFFVSFADVTGSVIF